MIQLSGYSFACPHEDCGKIIESGNTLVVTKEKGETVGQIIVRNHDRCPHCGKSLLGRPIAITVR